MMWALGFMSGTSAEGVDAAYLRTDGETIEAFGPTLYEPLTPEERSTIRSAMTEAVARGDAVAGELSRAAGAAITAAHLRLIARLPNDAPTLEIAGFHGQTLFHRPPPAADPMTWQVGDPDAVAEALGAPVVCELRQADIAAGGQGAPLVPVFHRALAKQLELDEPVAILNIGGVSNLTYIDGDTLIAFDCGPGNAPLDEWAERRLGKPFDEDGAHAARGAVDADAVDAFLTHPFFSARPPKSLDRYGVLPALPSGMSPHDEAATLTACVANGIAAARTVLPKAPALWIVCGGGARNPVLMRRLREALGAPVDTAEGHGLTSDFIEAQAFAFLAVRSVRGLPITYPGTTGIKAPMSGGRTVAP